MDFKTKVFIGDISGMLSLEMIEKLMPKLTAVRQEKVMRMRQIKGKALSVGAELLLQKALYKSFGIEENLVIGFGEFKKPFLKSHPEIQFNLSHSGDYVVCVLSSDPIGIDIQKKIRLNHSLIERYFSEMEKEQWRDLPKHKKEAGFFNLWAGKESYMKYTGQGFNLPLKDFTLCFSSDNQNFQEGIILEKGIEAGVYLKRFEGPQDYYLWCCGKNKNYEEKLTIINLTEERELFGRTKIKD